MGIEKQNTPRKVTSKPDVGEQAITFSFRYFTDKKDFSLDYFNGQARDKLKAYEALHEKMAQLSEFTTEQCKQNGKISGCEGIPYVNFNQGFKSIIDNCEIISRDSKMSVFRFGNQNYRLICKTGIKDNNVLYIIGMDWNFSAYPH